MPPPFSVAAFVSLLLLSACASAVPSSRLAEYVPPEQPTEDLTTVAGRQNLQAALVIISEMTAAPEGSSPLPDEAMRQVADNLQAEISRALPVSIQDVLYRDGTKLKGRGTAAWQELAKETKHPYLALVVMSSTEQEYPVVLKVGGDRHAQPGLRRDNWSLLEFALLDVKNGKVLLRTEARGWATLDRPTAPDINQFYPVIYLRPQEPLPGHLSQTSGAGSARLAARIRRIAEHPARGFVQPSSEAVRHETAEYLGQPPAAAGLRPWKRLNMPY